MTTNRLYWARRVANKTKFWTGFAFAIVLAIGLFAFVQAMFGGWWIEGPSTEQILDDLNQSYANYTKDDAIRRNFKIAQVDVMRTKRRGWSGNKLVLDIEMVVDVEPNATQDPSLRAGLAALREDGSLWKKRAPLRLTYRLSRNNPDRDWSLVEIGKVPERR